MSSTTSLPAWTNEKVVEFLQLYQAHPIIWNAPRKDHKNRNLQADAWRNIQQNMKMIYSIEELKKKPKLL
ncbi:unnamed protein product [Acanthoscelides obtectus]|uniref:MADF domain-containing protein n=1 Tax=Acanthoscelides obtectus TaxID=200917 RepID=A0A9P0K4K4_ACAOB|nr:unnamed protein product [Acanthoscelides obtectus]CAK1633185.1 hypothetical protein AOBTE_LOCUS7983 [Acanthoscelides obtectus]